VNFRFLDPGAFGVGQPHPPEMVNWLNILKTIEILTPKPYIFMSLVLQAIYAIHYTCIWPLGSTPPPEMGNWLNIHVLYVIGNVCSTLYIVPGVKSTPQKWKIAKYLEIY
jgi:hypothetical protein